MGAVPNRELNQLIAQLAMAMVRLECSKASFPFNKLAPVVMELVSTLSDDDMGEVTFNIIAYKYVPKWTSRCSGLQIDVSSHSFDDTAICFPR